ncbi:MAG: hypothetical protein F4052_01650 [Dehalococcoidia bacterium]|nr:hypothetical protein [Dehalococcoidia bacterium]
MPDRKTDIDGGTSYSLESFDDGVRRMAELLKKLTSSDERQWGYRKGIPQAGVYVFFEKGAPTYVGRSDKLSNRIGQHGWRSSDKNGATLAFKMLKRSLSAQGKAEGEKDADIAREYDDEFLAQKEKVRSMTYRVVAIDDDLEQHLFETYAICKFGTSPHHNDFRNH